MKRYNEKTLFNMTEADNGAFVTYADVLEMMQPALGFVFDHADDIENKVGDLGALMPLLEMIRGKVKG